MASKYKTWYDALMSRAKGRCAPDGHVERHHILPRCLKGTDDPTNIVVLTYREHFLAHWLLTKFTRGQARRKMLTALHHMGFFYANGKRIVASWQYETSRKAAREAMLGEKLSENTRKKMGEASRLFWSNPENRARTIAAQRAGCSTPEARVRRSEAHKGLKHSEETKAKIGRPGQKRSLETRAKISAAARKRWAQK